MVEIGYILATVLFIVGLRMMSSPEKARRGNLLSAVGMLLAVGVTLLHREILGFQWILAGLVIGSVIGVVAAYRVAMTAMPGMVGLLNGSGGLASMLVAMAEFVRQPATDAFTGASVILSVLIGGVTFTGSVVAWGKLSEMIPGRPVQFQGQRLVNAGLLLAALACSVLFCLAPAEGRLPFYLVCLIALALGVLAVIPIGGADMPVVISLLNSYSGLAACATGFVLKNSVLIVTGSLVGASGIILTKLMCQAMNRSLANVLFSGFGAVVKAAAGAAGGKINPIQPDEVYVLLEAARSVVVVPGYGLAVAQAQHAVRELAECLEGNGAEVRYAIHPVAGRMPGHMNVLLAEANIGYDQLVEMEAINPAMPTVDVCLVIGANDVVNPAAHDDPASPIFGMPIIEAVQARTVIILKRSMAPGFAGIENHLFHKENARMLFGDAKASVQALIAQFKSGAGGVKS